MFLKDIPQEVKFAAHFIFPEYSYNLLFSDNSDQNTLGFVSFIGEGIKGFECKGKNYLTLFENVEDGPLDKKMYFIADTEYITRIDYPKVQAIMAGQKTTIQTIKSSRVILNEDG